ncbi:hypothetical protein [Nocardia gipuzkoensis]|nr:hypothetical protein [Nocardia gipuzkoensis]MDE1675127.1 hypothetical protein [Nocardia gipuzkoensis]
MDTDALMYELGQRSISDPTVVPEDPPPPENAFGVLGLAAAPPTVVTAEE